MNGDPSTYTPISSFDDEYFRDNVTENVAHAWYEGDETRHPFEGETVPDYTDFEDDGKYSWVKAPRFDGNPMQVGPLAQVLCGVASGHEAITRVLNDAVERASGLAGTQLGLQHLHSTLGRHLARAVRATVLAELSLKHWDLLATNIGGGDTDIYVEPVFPSGEIRGFGFHEAPRGVLSHWTVIRDGNIANYQAVVPSTWNAGPRDERGQQGPYEASLMDNPVADIDQPLEVVRTVHSFDPCLACAIHTFDPEGKEVATVRAVGPKTAPAA
jgi:hydrogenase large subunit